MLTTSPHETLQQLSGAYFISRSLHAVADAGVADALGDEPATATALAEATGLHPRALHRVLTLLSAHGVFQQVDGAFAHTPASRLLTSDHPQSMRSFVRMFGLPLMWTAAEAIANPLRTGRAVGEEVLPGGFWGYFAQNAEAARIFDEAMAGKARAQVAGALAAYDFSRFSRIADVGGGRGHLIQAILAAHPGATGVLFDLPHVVQEASHLASERLSLEGGDCFKDPLPACDAYLLMEVIHDWPDDEARQILQAVHRAAPERAKLLVIEAPLPTHGDPSWIKVLDIVMLDLFGGSQRTADEYEQLLSSSGFRLVRAIDLGAGYSMYEAEVQ